MQQRSHIVVIYTTAGGGHVAAAKALKETLEATGQYRVTLLNPYAELMSHMDLWERLTGRKSEDIYNQSIIGEGRTGLYCLAYYVGVLLNFRLNYREGRKILAEYLAAERPDMVISVLPMFNRVIFDAVQDFRARDPRPSKTRNVVLITDWTEFGRHIWFPKGQDYHAVCGTEDAYRRASGYKNLVGRVWRTQGLLLKPSFQAGPPEDKATARVALGLAPDRPVICMLYGAQGSWRMRDLALSLKDAPPNAQVLFLCGHNRQLETSLEQTDWPFPVRVFGFTDQVPLYLGASDVFVGKPGPGSVSEALTYGLYLLLDRKMALPQEVPVLKWAQRTGAGGAFRTPRDFRNRLDAALAQAEAREGRSVARANTASAEIADIVAAIFAAET